MKRASLMRFVRATISSGSTRRTAGRLLRAGAVRNERRSDRRDAGQNERRSDMGAVFKKTVTKPLPAGAKIIVREGATAWPNGKTPRARRGRHP